ncbi:Pentatricopeptide repeat-containing protein, partial [Cucurbita argyrosperma subsp. argyrosperma]
MTQSIPESFTSSAPWSSYEDWFRERYVGTSALIHLFARKVFDGMLERSVVSWTSLICGYPWTESSWEAVALFLQMIEAGVKPESVTMVCGISACAELKDLTLAKKIHGYIDETETRLNTRMVNVIVDMYKQCGEAGAAKLYDECVDKNLVLCDTIMSNFVCHGVRN